MNKIALVRYGVVPEVARCEIPEALTLQRGDAVIVRTQRGLQAGFVLDMAKPPVEPGVAVPAPSFQVERLQTETDFEQINQLRSRAECEFDVWIERIQEWQLDLQLIDIDWTLDEEKTILYVLNERGPECTKLALQAVTSGLGVVEVQPVGAEGPVVMPPSSGGCGTCGCH